MQTLTFACPLCARRMGVGLELIGRPVRCPHCRQVVVAPTAANAPATPGAAPAAPIFRPATPPPPAPAYRPPDFSLPQKDGAESIFSAPGTEDDSVFESSQVLHQVELPDARPSLQATESVVRTPEMLAEIAPSSPGVWGNTMAIPVDAPAPRPSASDTVNPFAATPAMFGQKPSEVSSPWTKLEDLPSGQSKPLVSLLPPLSAQPSGAIVLDKLAAEQHAPGVAFRAGLKKYAFAALAAYALVVTLLAGWGYFRGGDRGHPLNNIPDFFGQYAKASREKVSELKVDDKLIPPGQKAHLRGTVTVGELRVEPLEVAQREYRQFTVYAGADATPLEKKLRNPCLGLRLKLTNLSRASAWFPSDPAWHRKNRVDSPAPLTGLELDGRRFMGGPILWPFSPDVKRIYVEGQEADDEPLLPGKSRETVVLSADTPELLDAVKNSHKPILWRVHLRRGFTHYGGENVSVGALVGVEFEASEVKREPG